MKTYMGTAKSIRAFEDKIAQAGGYRDHTDACNHLEGRKMIRDANRREFVNELIAQTKPELTKQFCFDGFFWSKDKPVLELKGDFDTPNFTLTFQTAGKILVSPDKNTSWAMIVDSDYADFTKLVKDILACMWVIQIKAGGNI
jgi:hypothetical protein